MPPKRLRKSLDHYTTQDSNPERHAHGRVFWIGPVSASAYWQGSVRRGESRAPRGGTRRVALQRSGGVPGFVELDQLLKWSSEFREAVRCSGAR